MPKPAFWETTAGPRAEAMTAKPVEGWGHAEVTPGAAGTVPTTTLMEQALAAWS